MRDLTRAREDSKAIELRTKQQLGAFLLRHGRVYETGKTRWQRGILIGWKPLNLRVQSNK